MGKPIVCVECGESTGYCGCCGEGLFAAAENIERI